MGQDLSKQPSSTKGKHGGYRPGGGRKKGSVNKINQMLREKVAKTGLTPLQVMQRVYTKFLTDAEKMQAGEEQRALLEKAVAVAHRAAPYMHGIVQPVQHDGSQTQKITHEHHHVVDPGEAYLKLVKGA